MTKQTCLGNHVSRLSYERRRPTVREAENSYNPMPNSEKDTQNHCFHDFVPNAELNLLNADWEEAAA